MPIWGMWPVWFSVGVVYLSCTKLARAPRVGKVLLILIAICLALFLLIHGILLLAYPYSEQRQEIAYSENKEELPLQVSFQYGEFTATHSPSTSSFLYNSYDIANRYVFDKSAYKSIDIERRETDVEPLYLRLASPTSFLTRFWSRSSLTIPSEFSGEEVYDLYESKATLDFRKSVSAKVRVMLQYTNITIYFPKTEGDKMFTVYGGSNLPGVLLIPRSGPSYEILNTHRVIAGFPPEFVKKDDGTYFFKGDKEGTVTIEVTVANIGGGLAVRMANE